MWCHVSCPCQNPFMKDRTRMNEWASQYLGVCGIDASDRYLGKRLGTDGRQTRTMLLATPGRPERGWYPMETSLLGIHHPTLDFHGRTAAPPSSLYLTDRDIWPDEKILQFRGKALTLRLGEYLGDLRRPALPLRDFCSAGCKTSKLRGGLLYAGVRKPHILLLFCFSFNSRFSPRMGFAR